MIYVLWRIKEIVGCASHIEKRGYTLMHNMDKHVFSFAQMSLCVCSYNNIWMDPKIDYVFGEKSAQYSKDPSRSWPTWVMKVEILRSQCFVNFYILSLFIWVIADIGHIMGASWAKKVMVLGLARFKTRPVWKSGGFTRAKVKFYSCKI